MARPTQSRRCRAVRPLLDGDEPRLIQVGRVSGFFEQVGRHAGYIIHPEEILADNFALLVLGGQAPRSPEVLKKIAAALERRESAEREDATGGDGSPR